MLQRAVKFKNYFSRVSFLRNITVPISHEEYILDILNKDNKSGVIIDVGFNNHVGTDKIARKYPNYQFNAYEPIPQKAKRIRKSADDLRLLNINIFDYTFGDEDGQICLPVPLGQEETIDIGYWDTAEGEVLLFFEVKRMDALSEVKNSSLPILGIRINQKGNIWSVLTGAKKTLKKHRPVIFCELEAGEDRDHALLILKELDYCILTIEKGKMKIHDQLKENLSKVVFVHKTFLLYASSEG